MHNVPILWHSHPMATENNLKDTFINVGGIVGNKYMLKGTPWVE